MSRYLMTHSLLSSWLYAIKENPYEDATSVKDPMGEFMLTLRREQTPVNEAIANGITFENLVTAILTGARRFHVIYHNDKTKEHREYNTAPTESAWFAAAEKLSRYITGARLQYKASTEINIDGTPIILYGRLDALKAGTIYDIKFSDKYERGKYFTSTQHPAYLKIIPEARRFVYLISDGGNVWTEGYDREETPNIAPVISDFLAWLREMSLMEIYREKWMAK